MAQATRRLPRFTDRLDLGSRGLRISPFCLGIVGDPQIVSYAFDRGINFFFVSCDMHWPFYEASRQGLRMLLEKRPSVRDEIVIGAVCYPTQPEFCSVPFMELLEAVPQLKYLDVLIAGGAYVDEYAKRLPVYKKHLQSAFLGARAIGTTFHERKAALAAYNEEDVDIAFIRYNPYFPGARKDLFPFLGPSRTLLFNFKNTMAFNSSETLAEIGITEKKAPDMVDHYRFALSRTELNGLLMGMSKQQHLEALEAALDAGPLSGDQEERMLEIARVFAAMKGREKQSASSSTVPHRQ